MSIRDKGEVTYVYKKRCLSLRGAGIKGKGRVGCEIQGEKKLAKETTKKKEK